MSWNATIECDVSTASDSAAIDTNIQNNTVCNQIEMAFGNGECTICQDVSVVSFELEDNGNSDSEDGNGNGGSGGDGSGSGSSGGGSDDTIIIAIVLVVVAIVIVVIAAIVYQKLYNKWRMPSFKQTSGKQKSTSGQIFAGTG